MGNDNNIPTATETVQVNADPAPQPEVASNPDATSSIGGFSALSGMDVPASPVPSAAPAPTPAAPAKPASKWEGILLGALQGMTAGAGQKFFGTGMAAGGAAVLAHNQQQTENQQHQQQIDIQQQADNREQQMQPYRIKFMSAQAASLATETALHDKELHTFDADHQNLLTNQALSQMKTLQDLDIAPTLVMANNKGGSEAMAGMEQLTSTHGAVPPMFTLNLGHQIVAYDLTQVTQAPQVLTEVNKVRAITGQAALTPQAWAQIPDQLKIQQTSSALGFFNPLPDEKTLTVYKNYLATANAAPDSPEKAANVSKLQGIVDNMQTVLDESQSRATKQDVDAKKAVITGTAQAEANAAGLKAGAVAEAQNRATLAAVKNPDGSWNPASTPVSLVEGTMDPSQLSKRGKDYNSKLEQANQYSIQTYGKPFDIAQAQTDYKYANQKGTQDALKYVQSIVAPKGELDIVQNAAQMLPKTDSQFVNKLINSTKTQFGSAAETNFHTAVMSFADTYAKVMGGGVATDTGRQQGLDLVKSAFSKGQLSGAMDVLHQDVNARQAGIIGNNRYLQRQFGATGSAVQTPQAAPQGAIGKIKGSDGNLYWTSDGKTGNLGRAQ